MIHARTRLVRLVCLACSLAFLVVVGAGCANGGDASSAGDDSSVPGDDGPTGDVTGDGASTCDPPRKRCGSTCTSTTNDPKNCGTCGMACGKDQVCSNSTCSYGCTPPEVLCNAPVEGGTDEGGAAEGGAGDSGTQADGAATSDAAAGDAAAMGDGGATAPYCANTGTDTSNCGTCGHVCGAEHTCNTGTCELSCGPGQTACKAADVCIATGTCCSGNDCAVTGQICPQPGGTCQCPGGETMCSKSNSCISSSDCCTDTDCSAIAGASCPIAGQPCQCSGGLKACPATKRCVPQTTCCTAAGECCADSLGKSCSAATAQPAVALGQTVNASGLLTAAGEEDWIQVTFNSENNVAFHAHVVFTANPNSEFLFDIASDCNGSLRACGEGGTCQGKTEWEVSYAGGSPAPDPNSTGFKPIPAIGTTYIRVYRVAGGTPTCDQWSLAISE
jgi:hypothetical protein